MLCFPLAFWVLAPRPRGLVCTGLSAQPQGAEHWACKALGDPKCSEKWGVQHLKLDAYNIGILLNVISACIRTSFAFWELYHSLITQNKLVNVCAALSRCSDEHLGKPREKINIPSSEQGLSHKEKQKHWVSCLWTVLRAVRPLEIKAHLWWFHLCLHIPKIEECSELSLVPLTDLAWPNRSSRFQSWTDKTLFLEKEDFS